MTDADAQLKDLNENVEALKDFRLEMRGQIDDLKEEVLRLREENDVLQEALDRYADGATSVLRQIRDEREEKSMEQALRIDCEMLAEWEESMAGFGYPDREAIVAFVLRRHAIAGRPAWTNRWVTVQE